MTRRRREYYERKHARREAEARGEIADSMAVRAALVRRVDAGEITLEEAQAELRRIQRDGRAAGMRLYWDDHRVPRLPTNSESRPTTDEEG